MHINAPVSRQQLLGQLQVVRVDGDGLAVHHDRLGPETGDARAVFAEGRFQRVGVVGLERRRLRNGGTMPGHMPRMNCGTMSVPW